MNKYEKIELVRTYGLNTEENILIRPSDNLVRMSQFLDGYNKCSVRTFRGDDVVTPHFPILRVIDAYIEVSRLIEKNYNVIVATPIDPKDCEFAGCAWLKENEMIIELAYGPGTVRRVTHQNIIDKRYHINFFNKSLTDDLRVNKAIKQFKETGLANVIFEFSYYNKPIGYKKNNLICWEITDDGYGLSKI